MNLYTQICPITYHDFESSSRKCWATSLKAVQVVSEDFFNYLPGKRSGEIGLVIADVTGKAMKGAMSTVMTNGILHSIAKEQEHLSPAVLLMELQ